MTLSLFHPVLRRYAGRGWLWPVGRLPGAAAKDAPGPELGVRALARSPLAGMGLVRVLLEGGACSGCGDAPASVQPAGHECCRGAPETQWPRDQPVSAHSTVRMKRINEAPDDAVGELSPVNNRSARIVIVRQNNEREIYGTTLTQPHKQKKAPSCPNTERSGQTLPPAVPPLMAG